MPLIELDDLIQAMRQEDKRTPGIPWSITRVQRLASQIPTIVAAPVNNNPCGFCGKFNFGDAKAEVYSHGANIVFASALTRFPVEKQFNFCPVCGRRVKKGGADND